jgi:hypothetical protein
VTLRVGDFTPPAIRRPPSVEGAPAGGEQPAETAASTPAASPPGDGFDPPKASPVNLGNDNATAAAGQAGAAAAVENKLPSYPGGIDRTQFLSELQKNPGLINKAAWMVNGEVGRDAPLSSKMAILETAFNRAQARGQSLSHVLQSVGESKGGYYARDTYAGRNKPSAAEVDAFKKNVLAPVLSGSDVTSQAGHGPMTGNASGSVAANQLKKGTPGFGMKIAGGQTEYLFNEEHRNLNGGKKALPRLDEASAQTAAQAVHDRIPNAVVPAQAPEVVRNGASQSDQRTEGVSRRRARRAQPSQQAQPTQQTQPHGRHRRGHRAEAEQPVPQQVAQSQSPLAQQLQAMGLDDQSISKLLSQLNMDPGFQQFLNGQQPTPELMQQYLQQNPDKAQQMVAALQQPTPVAAAA